MAQTNSVSVSDLFVQQTWKQYTSKNNDTVKKVNQQVIYITDRDLYVQRKEYSKGNFVDIIYSGKYGFETEVGIESLKAIQDQLIAGLYLTIQNTNGNKNIVLYYYDGQNNKSGSWTAVSSSVVTNNTSKVLTVNGIKPDDDGDISFTVGGVKLNDKNDFPISVNGAKPNADGNIELDIGTGGSSSITLTINGKTTDANGNLVLTPSDIGAVTLFDSTSTTEKDNGNIQLNGYVNGLIDGGGW